MTTFKVVCILLCGFIVSGCSGLSSGSSNGGDNEADLDRKSPPHMEIVLGDEKHGTVMGSYCWDTSGPGEGDRTDDCIDKAGIPELMASEEPIDVEKGETLAMEIVDFTLDPNDVHLSLFEQGEVAEEMDITSQNGEFTAPDEKGTYVFEFHVSWTNDGTEDGSYGDVYYGFVLKVE